MEVKFGGRNYPVAAAAAIIVERRVGDISLTIVTTPITAKCTRPDTCTRAAVILFGDEQSTPVD